MVKISDHCDDLMLSVDETSRASDVEEILADDESYWDVHGLLRKEDKWCE